MRAAAGRVSSKLALAYTQFVVLAVFTIHNCVVRVMELIVIHFEFFFLAREKEVAEKVYPSLVDVVRAI